MNCSLYAQKNAGKTCSTLIRPKIGKLVLGISKDNVLKSSGVGEAGIRTEQWMRYEKLNLEATDAELRLLTGNENAVVRCYAFQALSHRPGMDLYSILVKHLSDTVSVETFMGCIKSAEKAGDYFLEVVTPDYIDVSSRKLTKNERKLVDSILLFDKSIKLSAKYGLLRVLKPDLKYYNRIKEIAVVENNPVAVLALAKFNNVDDIDIVKKLFGSEDTEYYGIYAVREFPEATFYPYLNKVFEREWNRKTYDYPKWRILYQALAKYPTKKTLELFEKTVTTDDGFRYQTLGVYLTVAIRKYPNGLYQSLKDRIKLNKYHLEEVNEEENSGK